MFGKMIEFFFAMKKGAPVFFFVGDEKLASYFGDLQLSAEVDMPKAVIKWPMTEVSCLHDDVFFEALL